MQIKKPSKKHLKNNGFKLKVERQYSGSNIFVQCIDKAWFERHSDEYLTSKRVFKIYENNKQVLIYIGG
jgi:hypothetical protein